MKTTTKELSAALKSALPRGFSGVVSRKCNVSRQAVYDILRRFDTHSPVLHELIKMAEDTQAKRREAELKIGNLKEELDAQ